MANWARKLEGAEKEVEACGCAWTRTGICIIGGVFRVGRRVYVYVYVGRRVLRIPKFSAVEVGRGISAGLVGTGRADTGTGVVAEDLQAHRLDFVGRLIAPVGFDVIG